MNNITRKLDEEVVFLIHGFYGTEKTLLHIDKALSHSGFTTNNITYPTTTRHIFEIAYILNHQINKYYNNRMYHFVTHSMGSLVLRELLEMRKKDSSFYSKVGRVVTIAPVSNGSKLAKELFSGSLRTVLFGPALDEMNDISYSSLNKYDIDVLSIVGDNSKSLRPDMWIGKMLLSKPNDGVLDIDDWSVDGKNIQTITVHDNHVGLTKNKKTIKETVFFLKKAAT